MARPHSLCLSSLSSWLVHLGWRSRLPEPPLDSEGVRPGQGGGEAGEEVEAAHQQGRVAQGGDGGRVGVVEFE